MEQRKILLFFFSSFIIKSIFIFYVQMYYFIIFTPKYSKYILVSIFCVRKKIQSKLITQCTLMCEFKLYTFENHSQFYLFRFYWLFFICGVIINNINHSKFLSLNERITRKWMKNHNKRMRTFLKKIFSRFPDFQFLKAGFFHSKTLKIVWIPFKICMFKIILW